jgi:hypothetical protein
MPVDEACRKMGISGQAFYRGKKVFIVEAKAATSRQKLQRFQPRPDFGKGQFPKYQAFCWAFADVLQVPVCSRQAGWDESARG